MALSNNSAIEDGKQVVGDYVERQTRESYLRLGFIAQKIAANSQTADDLTLLDLFMQVSQAKDEHNTWMDW